MVNGFLALVQSHRRYAALPQLRRTDRRDLRSFQFQRGLDVCPSFFSSIPGPVAYAFVPHRVRDVVWGLRRAFTDLPCLFCPLVCFQNTFLRNRSVESLWTSAREPEVRRS